MVTFLTTPFLARLFDPSEYGLFALLASVATMASILSNLTLPASLLVIPKEKMVSATAGIIGYSVLTNLIFLLAGLLIATSKYFNLSYNGISPIYFVVIIPLSSFFVTITQIFASINIRNREFKNNVVVSLIDNFSIRIASLLLGVLGYTKLGLFYSELIGKGMNIINQLYFKTVSLSNLSIRAILNIKNIVATIVENKEYPLFNLPVSLIASFSGQLILWTLAFGYSRTDVGYFTMALGLLNIPLMLFSNSIQPLLTSKLFEDLGQFRLKKFLSLVFKIFVLAILIYLTIYLLAPYFVKMYLGVKWVPSVPLIQVLCFPFALQLLGNSIGGAFLVFKKQRANFIIKLVFLVILLPGFYFFIKLGTELIDVIIFYAIVLLLEEVFKVTYLSMRLNNVRNSRLL